MNATKQETHRPGALKQSNKQHKTGRHRSKSVINNELKGKLRTFYSKKDIIIIATIYLINKIYF